MSPSVPTAIKQLNKNSSHLDSPVCQGVSMFSGIFTISCPVIRKRKFVVFFKTIHFKRNNFHDFLIVTGRLNPYKRDLLIKVRICSLWEELLKVLFYLFAIIATYQNLLCFSTTQLFSCYSLSLKYRMKLRKHRNVSFKQMSLTLICDEGCTTVVKKDFKQAIISSQSFQNIMTYLPIP